MSTDMTTAKQQLAEMLYPGDLPADVARMLADGESWRGVAKHVSDRTGVTVSHETMRNWYSDPLARAG